MPQGSRQRCGYIHGHQSSDMSRILLQPLYTYMYIYIYIYIYIFIYLYGDTHIIPLIGRHTCIHNPGSNGNSGRMHIEETPLEPLGCMFGLYLNARETYYVGQASGGYGAWERGDMGRLSGLTKSTEHPSTVMSLSGGSRHSHIGPIKRPVRASTSLLLVIPVRL